MSHKICQPAWRQFRRLAKITPAIIQELFTAYMEQLNARGITSPGFSKMVRSEILTALSGRFRISEQHVSNILRRQAWNDQPVPDDWIPYI